MGLGKLRSDSTKYAKKQKHIADCPLLHIHLAQSTRTAQSIVDELASCVSEQMSEPERRRLGFELAGVDIA